MSLVINTCMIISNFLKVREHSFFQLNINHEHFDQIIIQHIFHVLRKIKQVIYIIYAKDIYFMKSLAKSCIS